MPMVACSSYRSPVFFRNPHAQTIWAGTCRMVPAPPYRRERIATPDDDFFDLDRMERGCRRVALLCHGLEGDSRRSYMRGMARALRRRGWDVAALNLRGCSGEPNRRPGSYHSGATADPNTAVKHLFRERRYRQLALIGFSLGGNLVLKYLGELGADRPSSLIAAVTFSVPCDLASASRRMGHPENRLYMKRFLVMLKQKLAAKAVRFSDRISLAGFDAIRDFYAFDNRYTAPLNGFADAEEYWEKSSSRPYLTRIAVPTLLVNAADDPFLSPLCFPFREAYRNPHLHLEIPIHGGHVGFVSVGRDGDYWSERRALEFIEIHAIIEALQNRTP